MKQAAGWMSALIAIVTFGLPNAKADDAQTIRDVATCEMVVIQTYPSVSSVDWPKPAQALMYACMRSKGYAFSLKPALCTAPMPFLNEACYFVDTPSGRADLEKRTAKKG